MNREQSVLRRVIHVAAFVMIAYPHKVPTIRLPGHRIRRGMSCPDSSCPGHVRVVNSVYRCDTCHSVIEPR